MSLAEDFLMKKVKKITVPKRYNAASTRQLERGFRRLSRMLGKQRIPTNFEEMTLSIVTNLEVPHLGCLLSVCFSSVEDCPRAMEFLADGTSRWHLLDANKTRPFKTWETGVKVFLRYLYNEFAKIIKDATKKRKVLRDLLR